MNDINNDEVRLFDSGKKLTFSDCPETSLDGIGSDLLSHDFLKEADSSGVFYCQVKLNDNGDNGMSRREGAGDLSDPLLIMNNDLSSQRQITLDDVVDLDLSSLSTLENNGISQHPPESLEFNDFLSGGGFCLNGLSEKLSEPDKQLNFDSLGDIHDDQNLCKIQGKDFKVVPTFVDGKLSNTLHLEDHMSNPKLFQLASTSSDLSVSAACPVTTAVEKITATIEDFPSLSMVTGNTLTLNGQVQATLPPNEIEPDISDLITVKPREIKKTKKRPMPKTKTSLASVKKKKQKKLDRKNRKNKNNTQDISQEKSSDKKVSLSNPVKNKSASAALPPLTSDAPTLKLSESQPNNGIPKFKIVQQSEQTTCSDVLPTVTTSKFSNGSLFLPVTESSQALASPSPAPFVALATTAAVKPTQQQPIELILPVISVRDENSTKTVLKSISDLKPGDVPVGSHGLSQMQKQQIAVILKQREARKRATGNSSNGPKRNESNKIICKVLYPEDFVEAKQSNGSVKEAAKDEVSAKSADDGKSNDSQPKSKKAKLVRHPKPHINEEFEAEIPLAPSVTRSGRTSRPPKKLVKRESKSGVQEKKDEQANQHITSAAASTVEGADVAKPKPELLDGLPTKKKHSKKPAKFVCQTCGRGYIEAKVFMKHLEAFPTHKGNESISHAPEEKINPPKPIVPPPATTTVRPKRKCRCKCRSTENCRARSLSFKQMVDTISEREFIKTCGPRFVKTTSVWDFLLFRIKAIYKYEDYVKGLLSELGKLWDSLKAVSSKILFPCDHPSVTSVMIEDNTTCEVLGVSKGVYQTYSSGLDIPTPSVTNDYQGQPEPSVTQTTAIVPPPDTKEDISQSSLLSDILCDKSGMDTVDQLVSERLKTLAPGDDILEPPSDDLMASLLNSVHSNSLSDSMFNPLVSGSNEDLLKALENLSNPLDNPPPLDFMSLTNDYPDRYEEGQVREAVSQENASGDQGR